MIRQKGDWIASGDSEETVMLNLSTGKYLGLNAVGTRIWQMLEVPAAEPELCQHLIEEFDVSPENCRQAVRSFLTRMVEVGAIEITTD